MKNYTRTKNAVFNLGYHIIWCPKYRKNFLLDLDQQFLIRTFQIAAIKINGVIENIEIMPDHIHIFLRVKQNHISISKIVQMLKGFSSYTIRKKYQYMKKYKALWSPSYFVESIGNMSEKVIKKYIDNQKINVKPTYKFKNLFKDKSISSINEKEKESSTGKSKNNKNDRRTNTMFIEQFKIS